MAALVQTFPSQTSITMLQNRPGSAERYTSGSSQQPRSSQKYANMSNVGYRGLPATGPVAPYAFTNTPQLSAVQAQQRSQPSGRTSSASQVPQLPQLNLGSSHLTPSMSTPSIPSSSSTGSVQGAQASEEVSQAALLASGQPVKPSPDRYRRNLRRSEGGEVGALKSQGTSQPPSPGAASAGQMYHHSNNSGGTSTASYQSYRGTAYAPGMQTRQASSDDSQAARQSSAELASRYRRRSLGGIETAGLTHQLGDAADTASPHPNAFIQPAQGDYLSVQRTSRPVSSHAHSVSTESVSSSRSGRSSRPTSARNESSNSSVTTAAPVHVSPVSKQDTRVVNVPPRHSEPARRGAAPPSTPSPLSRPMTLVNEDEHRPGPASQAPRSSQIANSPAAEHLAALNEKEAKKGKSKLRRAFSFGSAAELRKATAQANLEKTTAGQQTNKRISRHGEELDPESARIAEKQEAAGLGTSIYSGQGGFFTGSTDNLSISSTASSASLMLRKMGKGMKKGSRSFVGLFRPKSVIGVPAADGPVNEASVAQVSMVTVEAEREKVNVNADPHDQQGGGTAFPKLERNSIDNKLSADSDRPSTETRSRRSIVGGEKERAEVLAAVKRGILKRADSNQSSPSLRPADSRQQDNNLPHVPHFSDSPRSSAPSTPRDEPAQLVHRRGDSITIENNDHHSDYFVATGYPGLDSKPQTPPNVPRNISFSPRIQFHDTWPSGEYDRRGEIATCNRLTPMLAQQIKEELNTFKMEMEVHESSKVYTHFF